MSSKRVFFIMLGGLALLVIVCLLVTSSGRKLIIAEGEKLTELKLEQEVLKKRDQALLQAQRDINKYKELEKIAKAVVPQDKDQARTVLELVALGRRSGINITSVTFPASELGQASKGKRTNSSNLSQLIALPEPKGVYAMNIDIGIDSEEPVHYEDLLSFLERLENNRRTAHVTNLSINPDESSRNFVTFTLSLTSYVKP